MVLPVVSFLRTRIPDWVLGWGVLRACKPPSSPHHILLGSLAGTATVGETTTTSMPTSGSIPPVRRTYSGTGRASALRRSVLAPSCSSGGFAGSILAPVLSASVLSAPVLSGRSVRADVQPAVGPSTRYLTRSRSPEGMSTDVFRVDPKVRAVRSSRGAPIRIRRDALSRRVPAVVEAVVDASADTSSSSDEEPDRRVDNQPAADADAAADEGQVEEADEEEARIDPAEMESSPDDSDSSVPGSPVHPPLLLSLPLSSSRSSIPTGRRADRSDSDNHRRAAVLLQLRAFKLPATCAIHCAGTCTRVHCSCARTRSMQSRYKSLSSMVCRRPCCVFSSCRCVCRRARETLHKPRSCTC